MIKIILVDDHELVLRSWKELLESNPNVIVTGTSANAEDALSSIEKDLPDIALIDIKMEPVNGFDLARIILQRWPGVRVIGLSVHDRPTYVRRMLALGAHGYLTKTSSLPEIHTAIETVAKGEFYVCEEVRKKMK